MCGICGVVDIKQQGRVSSDIVRRMADAIRHRGPDGDGFYDTSHLSMGMRRLSIIDVDGSDQPLYNEDKSIALVFNGEIYNYRELQADLRAKGHQLRTDGDGETLIHLYESYGLDFFRYLRGMYALALWDENQQRLLLAVDHIGMKPLYLHQRDGKLFFASEAKALFVDEATPFQLNLDVLDTYLSFGYPLGRETLFDGVERLLPGHALIVENGGISQHPYWSFGENFDDSRAETLPDDEAQIINAAREHLTQSVDIHLRSDVPLGLFLSGGIDSAAALGLMAKTASGRIKTYTVGFDMATPDNELLHARRIARYFETDHHERIINAADWWAGLQTYAYHHDEPNANPSAISMLLLAEDTAKQVKVVLAGLGGDELFGGYMHHRAIPQLIQQQATWGQWLGKTPLPALIAGLEQYYPAMKRYRFIGAIPTYLPRIQQALLPRSAGLLRMQSFDGLVFSDALRDALYGGELKAAWEKSQHKEQIYQAILQDSWCADPYDTAQTLVINTWLMGNALLSQDKVTMAHSLEARVPFFDPALFAFAARIPSHIRMKANKYVLREALRPDLPDFALARPKQPFSTPIRGWFERDLKAQIQAVLLDDGAISRRLFNGDALHKLLHGHFSGRQKQEEVVFRLLNLELWYQAFARRSVPTAS